jgi:putative transposase
MSKQNNQSRERPRTPNNRTTTGFRISDEFWAVLEPLLPVHVNTHRFGEAHGMRNEISARKRYCREGLHQPFR